jgi:3-phenylpropionate/cinnamic acid dioxygenase small subunit
MTTAAQKIENLIYRYAELLDAGKLAAVAELFEDATITAPNGSETVGYDAVLAMYRASTRIYPATGTPCTQHVTSNVRVEMGEDGQTAEAWSKFTVFQALPDFPLQAIIAGHYCDSFACREDLWYFQRREIVAQLYGDLSRHLLFDASEIR